MIYRQTKTRNRALFPAMNEEELIRDVHHKIDREKILINAANSMRQSTDNSAVLSRLDTQIRDGRRNIEYLQGRLREIELRKMNQDMGSVALSAGNSGGFPPSGDPRHAERSNEQRPSHRENLNNDPTFDNAFGSGGYNRLSGGQGLMPPRAPYAPGPPNHMPKTKSNYSKLGNLPVYIERLGCC